ncbi:MAG: SusC/RagA family TonB-linked outer membrane protein [Saprospiraceae bacterium]|nr:SusC/RagA family TonB-linked outer membrane protein [Saprospiraceae bacterium]
MKKLCLLLFFAAVTIALYGQRTVSGVVTDSGGEPLIGANVLVKGTTIGTITDIDGSYNIVVPEGYDQLVVSYTGFSPREVALGASNIIDVSLEEGLLLQEAVVTAFGIEREKKELGYAVTTVDGEEIAKARSSNILDNLSGRVSGVRINSSSGTAGGSSSILIRGATSLGGNNQPLFVVDGVPISNSSFNGTRSEIIAGGADVGNRAADLNPDDIASISVLKGASAVALYGQRAKNGVIQITTKRARQQGISVDVNSSLRFSSPMKLPDFQNEYTTGDFGQYDAQSFSNGWGPRVSDVEGQTFSQFPYDGEERPLEIHEDNVKDFFRTGVTAINNVSFGTRSGNSDVRVSYTNFNEEGIIPENSLNRNTVSINAGTNFTEKIRARGVVNYVRTEGLGRPRQGSNNPNRIMSLIYSIPRTTDIGLLENNLIDDNGQVIGLDGNRTVNNVYYVLENNPFNNYVDRLYGNVQAEWDITPWLNLLGRAGSDVIRESRRNITSKGTINRNTGEFEDRGIYIRENNFDLIASAEFDLTSDLGLTALAGFNVNQIEELRTRLLASDLVVSELYNPANARSTNNQREERLRRLMGAYFDVGFSFKDYLFVNVTGRNDWSSTLPVENRSYFYPGVSTSFIFTDAFNIDNGPLSYGKLRASYASVGSDEKPYQLDFLFNPESDIFTQFVANNTFPIGGQSVFTGPDLLPAGNSLVPQLQNTFEVGTELQFYEGRVALDLTYYNSITSDQILSVSVAQSTGFDAVRRNVGEISNKGFEALISVVPVRSSDFEWELTTNYTQNEQVVEKLAPGLQSLNLTSGFSGLSIRAEEGESFGLYGAGWERSPDGEIVINAETGLRERGARTRLGNIFPDYQVGFNNRFTYKGVTLSALVDISSGGVVFSGTVAALRFEGLTEETARDRDNLFVDQGVNRIEDQDGNVTYVPNETQISSVQEYWQNIGNNSNTEGSVFDASYVKLREVTLSYALPQNILGDGFIKGLSIGIEGRNLWLIDSEAPHIDPEANFFGPSLIGGAANVEFYSVPTARSIGGNLKVTF